MAKTLDTIHAYQDGLGRPARCRMRLYEPESKPPVAIFTELSANPGSSVTMEIERLATHAWKWLERPKTAIEVIEHYDETGRRDGQTFRKEEFDRVFFTPTKDALTDPVWRRVSKAEVEQMIGQPLDDANASK